MGELFEALAALLGLVAELLLQAIVGLYSLWCNFFVWLIRRRLEADEEEDRQAPSDEPSEGAD